MALVNGGLLALYGHKEILKKSLKCSPPPPPIKKIAYGPLTNSFDRPRAILALMFHESVLGQDISEPQPSTGETKERH